VMTQYNIASTQTNVKLPSSEGVTQRFRRTAGVVVKSSYFSTGKLRN